MDQAYLPKSVLYATSARIGGVGLDAVTLETLRGLKDQLGLAIAYGLRTSSTGELLSDSQKRKADLNLSRQLIEDGKIKKVAPPAASVFLLAPRF
jgi:hypothetical protein